MLPENAPAFPSAGLHPGLSRREVYALFALQGLLAASLVNAPLSRNRASELVASSIILADCMCLSLEEAPTLREVRGGQAPNAND